MHSVKNLCAYLRYKPVHRKRPAYIDPSGNGIDEDSGVLIDTPGVREFGLVMTIQTHWPKYLKSLTMQNHAVSKIASISTNRVVLF